MGGMEIRQGWELANGTSARSSPDPKQKGLSQIAKPLMNLVGRAGFEPATNGLKVRCSTN